MSRCLRSPSFSLVVVVVATLGAVSAPAQVLPHSVRYRMLEGTEVLVFDPSGVVSVVPLYGTFDLAPSSLVDALVVDELRGFERGSGALFIEGTGLYTGRPDMWSHRMILDVAIGPATYHLDSGEVPNEAGFPMVEIEMTQELGSPDEPYYVFHLIGVPAHPLWFSTEVPFTQPDETVVSDGDICTTMGRVLWTNQRLTRNLAVQPPVPDVGVDAFHPTEIDDAAWWEAWFSMEVDVFSELLGPLGHGDFLSEAGFVAAYNDELLENFWPFPPDLDYGLDAITWGWWCGGWYFSTEDDFWSDWMGRLVGHGDLLCAADGWVVFSNAELLANFDPPPIAYDYGLDALYMWPSGHVWFSLDEGFEDARYGWISDGDLLSMNGWVVYRNLELVQRFDPIEDLDNFGLDALHVVPVRRGDMNGDTNINAFDIDPFVLALTDRWAYYEQYPELDPDYVGDCNHDGQFNAFDVDAFIALLVGGG